MDKGDFHSVDLRMVQIPFGISSLANAAALGVAAQEG